MTALTDPIPLRQNLAWGTFASGNAVHIPHRYGEVGGDLIQYDKQRLQFVWADHAVESIDTVLVNGAPAPGWTWANVLDVTGHPVALVTMQQPVDQGATPTARGKGKPHPRTGERMTDPAAILWDILANVAGRNVSESAFGAFSVACAARGLTAAGSIESPDQVLAICDALCSSVGAIFSAPNTAVIWPGVSALSVFTVEALPGITPQAASTVTGVINDLTIRYAFESGSPRQSIQLDAPASVARFGRRALTIDAQWINASRTAYDVAKRLLEQRARPQWNIHVDGIKRPVKIGQAVTLAHALLPVTGDHVITDTEFNFTTGLTAIDVHAPRGAVPITRIVQQSEAFDPQTFANVSVQTVGNDRVFNFKNNDGSPMANAAVTLPDGVTTRYTDSGGFVKFTAASMPPGTYVLKVVTADGHSFSAPVLVQ